MSNDRSNTGLAGEQTIPIQNGNTETRHEHRYEDVMRLHEAAPKLIVQERVGDKVKVSSYCPVALLTRAGLALGRLHRDTCGRATETGGEMKGGPV